MRIFLIGWDESVDGLVDVARSLEERFHEIIYWVAESEKIKKRKAEFPNTIFHNIDDALANIPAQDINSSEFSPVGEDLINKCSEAELTVLTMMNKKYESLLIDERKHFYYELLRYWNGIITKLKPDVIIFPVAPHTVYDFVIYSLAKLLNIKTVMFETTWVGDRLIVLNDFVKGSIKLKESVENLQKSSDSFDNLSNDIRSYYELQQNPRNDSTPSYSRDWKQGYSGINLFARKLRVVARAMRDGSIFNKIFSRIARKLKGDLKTEYLKLQIKPDFNYKYIYVPLNYQPERTTSPQGGVFVDQLLMIEILSYSVPDDWVIYVKEHPTQWMPRGTIYFSYRYRGYYKSISKLKNVKIIPVGVDTYKAINNSQAVATVTGTAGWEAVLRSKPAVVFGYPWYQHCHGVFSVNDVELCKRAIKEIKNGFSVNQNEIINYLAGLSKASMHGYLDLQGEKVSSLTREENTKNILRVLINEIES